MTAPSGESRVNARGESRVIALRDRIDANTAICADGQRPVAPVHYLAYVPDAPLARPPLVLVHGNDRAAGRLFRAFMPLATRLGVALLAPRFSRRSYPRYQTLAGTADELAAANALIGVLAHAQTRLRWPGGQVDLLGFSGGAQFAHRFALCAPERVRRLVCVSAGWYTRIQSERAFPQGIAAPGFDSQIRIETEAFLRLPMLLLVGDCDTRSDASLRTSAWLTRTQGAHRLERACRWTEHLHARAAALGISADIRLQRLPDTGHSLVEAVVAGGLVERVIDFLEDGHAAPAPAGGHGMGRDRCQTE